MKKFDLGFKYGMTYVDGGCDNASIDFGDSTAENDFFEFLITLAELKEIKIIKEYEEEAKEELEKYYDIENITESLIIAKTYILEMEKCRLWGEYEEGAKEALKKNNYIAIRNYFFELKNI